MRELRGIMVNALHEVILKLEQNLINVDLHDEYASSIDWKVVNVASFRCKSPSSFPKLEVCPYVPFDDSFLLAVDEQKKLLFENTRQFVNHLPANHVLLWGARGTGKSSLVHALLPSFAENGLRIIQVERSALDLLPDLLASLSDLPYRFLLFCDDLSFEAEDDAFKVLKSYLDGSFSVVFGSNVLFYATSNRRHLLPESVDDNSELQYQDAVEEKISLSDRFGLWLAFHPFNQATFLSIVYQWLSILAEKYEFQPKLDSLAFEKEAIAWALKRGNRSGRVAYQFASHYFARQCLLDKPNL